MRAFVLLSFLGACTGAATGEGAPTFPGGDDPAGHGEGGSAAGGGAGAAERSGGAGQPAAGGESGAGAVGGAGGAGGGTTDTGGAAGGTAGAGGSAPAGGAGGSGMGAPAGGAGGAGGSVGGAAGGAGGSAGGTPANLRPAIIGAGYGGIRVVSFDDGRTWVSRRVEDPNGGDDENLIRAIGYVNGVWIGAGWKIFRSEDGLSWTQLSAAQVPGGWYDCVTYDQARGLWIVKVIRSDYGGQNGEAIVSRDRGLTWQSTRETTRCSYEPMPFPTGSAQLKSEWKGEIWRMPSGGSWTRVLQDCCSVVRFARGMAVDPRAVQ